MADTLVVRPGFKQIAYDEDAINAGQLWLGSNNTNTYFHIEPTDIHGDNASHIIFVSDKVGHYYGEYHNGIPSWGSGGEDKWNPFLLDSNNGPALVDGDMLYIDGIELGYFYKCFHSEDKWCKISIRKTSALFRSGSNNELEFLVESGTDNWQRYYEFAKFKGKLQKEQAEQGVKVTGSLTVGNIDVEDTINSLLARISVLENL